MAGAQAPSAHAGLASPLAACGELSARRSKPPRTRSAAGNDPATYKPKTRYDNTPWRFDMEQNGRRMTADEFDAWMKARGVRVAKGAPAVKAQQESKRRRIARAERGR
ncbi:hypothetical protein DX914_00555 [Lysobacter silvisoli]|uniref:Uncharacterized protein n=1 Tax=Lysobacter silvisoli TaxID=2293254 RepID=A0A371K703_9GAMM|nr:hypothetical protein DX914_00555 [Lysobacter silvisoli]